MMEGISMAADSGSKAAVEVLADLVSRGMQVVVKDGRLWVSPRQLLSDADRQAIRQNKTALLALLSGMPTPEPDFVKVPPEQPIALPVSWPAALADLIQWFQTATLPTEPFALWPFAQVTNPERFRQSLEQDIAQGPAGVRARTGALLDDLRRLRQLFGEPQ